MAKDKLAEFEEKWKQQERYSNNRFQRKYQQQRELRLEMYSKGKESHFSPSRKLKAEVTQPLFPKINSDLGFLEKVNKDHMCSVLSSKSQKTTIVGSLSHSNKTSYSKLANFTEAGHSSRIGKAQISRDTLPQSSKVSHRGQTFEFSTSAAVSPRWRGISQNQRG